MMAVFNLCGIVDVGTYNTILDPAVTLDGDETSESQWDQFQFAKYMETVKELAVRELKKLLAKLPTKITYVEGSAWIDSPNFYNYRNDMLCFQAEADVGMTEKQLQQYIEDKLALEIDQEFDAAYRIYEYISGNYTVESFYETTD